MFAKKLKSLLEEQNLSVTEFSKRINVPKSNIQQWLQGSSPNINQVDQVARYFKMTIEELVFDRKPSTSIEELFSEVLVHSGNYKIQISKLVKKEE